MFKTYGRHIWTDGYSEVFYVQAELEKRNILLRKFQGNQVKGSEMTPLATPRSKTQHGSVPHAMKKNTPALPGSSSKKRKRHGGGGNDSSSQDGKRNKKCDLFEYLSLQCLQLGPFENANSVSSLSLTM